MPERVQAALRWLFPELEFKVARLEGHHGQRLLLYEGRSEDGTIGERLMASLPAEDRARLRAELQERTDGDGIFHLRLDKEEAFGGACALMKRGDAIDVQLLPAAYPRTREAALAVLARCLEGSGDAGPQRRATPISGPD